MAPRTSALRALAGGQVLDPVSTQRVSDVIAERLASAIRTGVLEPGDRLPTEQELAREFSVGRTSVREGLQKLRAHGLIETRKGLGAFVTAPRANGDALAEFARWTARDPAAIEELIEARLALETLAAALAALRARDAEIAELEAHQRAHVTAGETKDVPGLVRSDEAFHEGIIAAARNQFVRGLYGILIAELIDFRRKTLALPWAAARSASGHEEILAAIRDRDAGGARAAMADHLWVLYAEVHESATAGGQTGLALLPREAT
jgi:GntR family transcriptional regulator, transcriptional repressor for pyruvate dehydrogenase complex